MKFVRVVFIEYPDHHRDIVTILEDTGFDALEKVSRQLERQDFESRGVIASVLVPAYPNALLPKRYTWSTGPHYRDLETGEAKP